MANQKLDRLDRQILKLIAEDARIELLTPWWQTALTVAKVGFSILAAGSTILYLISDNRKKED